MSWNLDGSGDVWDVTEPVDNNGNTEFVAVKAGELQWQGQLSGPAGGWTPHAVVGQDADDNMVWYTTDVMEPAFLKYPDRQQIHIRNPPDGWAGIA